MTQNRLFTTVHDVLDPLTGLRHSLRWPAGGALLRADAWPKGQGRDIDGSHLWVLPALYDADAHLPMVPFGVRQSDLYRAMAGGIGQMNVALPWQQARLFTLRELVNDSAGFFPAIVPVLSVSPNEDSRDFSQWLKQHADEVKECLPSVCKLYSYDPHFERNLEAVWQAGLKAVVWNSTDEALERLVANASGRPLHLRHAVSAGMIAVMRRARQATLQSSPHFLLPLGEGKRESLTVLPPPRAPEDIQSLADSVLDQVDLLSSDHGAPHQSGVSVGPGLQTQQHFLPVLLTLCERYSWPLESILAKVTRAPAKIFGTRVPQGVLLVDPDYRETVAPWPNQASDRAPYEGLELTGRVLAISNDRQVLLV